MIESGLHKVVAVIGFQKMSELSISRRGGEDGPRRRRHLGIALRPDHARRLRHVRPGPYGDLRHHRRGSSPRSGSRRPPTARRIPKATYRKEVTLDAGARRPTSSPTRCKRFDCCANADGASCIILAKRDIARSVCKKPDLDGRAGSGHRHHDDVRPDQPRRASSAPRRPAGEAYTMARRHAERHRRGRSARLLHHRRDDGLRGPRLRQAGHRGGSWSRTSRRTLDGKIPVNVDGGLLSKGHPIGATGGSQVRTIVRQLRGEARGPGQETPRSVWCTTSAASASTPT